MSDAREIQQIRSLRLPIYAHDAHAPLVLRVATPSVPEGQESTQGPTSNPTRMREYVLLEALPRELAEKVRTAVEALSWG